MKVPGKLVTVNDTQMHVYSISSSRMQNRETIVFLAGSGTGCPTYDFKPLWYLLKDQFNMAIVERPGYGWSGQTECPRDIDTVLEETREALRQAGITGPFISAPHSMSGLEAIYWVQRYPEEVLSIIGLDMAIPSVYDSMKLPGFLSLQTVLLHLLRKPISAAMVKSHPAVKNNLLNEEEQVQMRRITARQLFSKNIVDEFSYVKDNARKVADGKCPSVPILCFLSMDKGIRKQTPSWGKAHRDYFAANGQVKFIELPCGHYLHNEVPEIIAEEILKFLK